MLTQSCMLQLAKLCETIPGHLSTLVPPRVTTIDRRTVCHDRARSAAQNRKLRQAVKTTQRCVLAAAEVPAQPADYTAPPQRDPSG